MPHYLIYMYIFPNGKKYIGKSTRSMSRRQGHNWNRYKTCPLLWKAIQKYGTENIETQILFEGDITHEEAAELERKYIAEYKTNVNRYRDPQYGYNLTDGGEGLVGWHPTQERYEQMMKQLEKAKEVRLAMGVSEETRRKQSEAKKGKKRGPMSDETKRKISEKNSFKNMPKDKRDNILKKRRKETIVTNIETNEQMIFESRNQVAEYFKVSPCTVSSWITEKQIVRNTYLIENYIPTTTDRERVAEAIM